MTYYVVQELIKGEIKKFISFYDFIEQIKKYTLLEIPYAVSYVN